MTRADDLDPVQPDPVVSYLADIVEDEESGLDRTRVEYGGIDLDDEFQPVDEVELAEEHMLLDDPERLAAELDDELPPLPPIDPSDVGWDLDAQG